MASIEAIREALQALVADAAGDADRELVREALASEGLQRVTGERAVAVGRDANGSTFVTGDNTVDVCNRRQYRRGFFPGRRCSGD